MNDRYLFKAKRIDNGEWVIGNLIRSEDVDEVMRTIIVPSRNSYMFAYIDDSDLGFENWYKVDQSTICQCTGLKDKTGNLIWENDIIDTEIGKAVAGWDCGAWRIKWIHDTIWKKALWYWVKEDDWTVEAIGNIFDNPELLEVE